MMENLDNKTRELRNFDLLNFVGLIEKYPIHIATINKENKPNLAVASDVKVLNKNMVLISQNEMMHTPENILSNENIVLTSFDEKWSGLRLTGVAKYFTSGKFFDKTIELFKNETANPKGAIVIKVDKVEEIF